MFFSRDDVVVNRQGVLGIVIGAAITLEGQVLYVCQIPAEEFMFFVGDTKSLKHYQINGKPCKRSTLGFSIERYLSTSL